MEAGFYVPGSMKVTGPLQAEWPGGGDPLEGTQYEWMDFVAKNTAAMDDRYRDAAGPGQCFYEMANIKERVSQPTFVWCLAS